MGKIFGLIPVISLFKFSISLLIILLCFISNGQQIEDLKNQKPFSISGNFGINIIGYNISGIEARMNPLTLMLSAQATANIYGISIPFSFRYSGKKVETMQPFNQFGLSPKYKWITLHGGYRNINFSNFTLAGHTFLGAGVELNPGKLRFGYVYGRFRDSNTETVFGPDTLRNFNRKGFAMRIGAGSDRNYLDFILLRIGDDTTSLDRSTQNSWVAAEQNGVMGINSRFSLSHSLTLETEVAASFFTTDINAPGFESLSDEPSFNFANRVLIINQSSELLTAIRSALNFRAKNTSMRLEYRRIDPGYRSMGAWYFTSDVEQVTLAPSFSLLKKKLLVRGSAGIQRDNLRNTKGATSVRAISSISASYNPVPKFGIDINYSNYSNNQRPGRLPLIDSLKQYHTTANFSFTPRLIILKEKYQHFIMLLYNRMELKDNNEYTAFYTENRAVTFQLNYNINLIEPAIVCMTGITHNRLNNQVNEYRASGLTAGVAKMFLKGKITTGWNNAFIYNHSSDQKGWVINSGLNAFYQINKHHSLRLNIYFINASYKDETASPSFHETKGDLGYVFTF